MAEKLTKRKLDALRTWARENPDKERMLGDTEVPGFYARARRGGVEFFLRSGKGRRSRRRIGRYGPLTLQDAREAARELHVFLARGGDLVVEKRETERRTQVLEGVADDYLSDLRHRAEMGATKGRRSSLASFERLLSKHVLPKLGATRVAEIDVGQIRRLHRQMVDTPGEANRMLTALSAVLGFAEQLGLRPAGSNPCKLVIRHEEDGMRKALTRDEMLRLGEALRQAELERVIHPSALLAVRLFALTGLRRSELLGHESKARRGDREGLRWGDVDLDAGTLRLQQTKTGPQVRVIGKAAVEVLRQARSTDFAPHDPVCRSPKVQGQPFVGIDRPRAKLYRAAGIEGKDLHSLRHAFASIGVHVASGRYTAQVSPLLGHAYTRAGSMTERYIHSDPDALRPAADAIAGAIADLLDGRRGASVVEIASRRLGGG